jgi:hypothetical protein
LQTRLKRTKIKISDTFAAVPLNSLKKILPAYGIVRPKFSGCVDIWVAYGLYSGKTIAAVHHFLYDLQPFINMYFLTITYNSFIFYSPVFLICL